MRPLKDEYVAQLRSEGGKFALSLAARLEQMSRAEYRAWLRAQRKAAASHPWTVSQRGTGI